jgi:hypothetical protein
MTPFTQPYQRAGASDLGVVITFVNVSALKQAERDLGKSGKTKRNKNFEIFETLAAAFERVARAK